MSRIVNIGEARAHLSRLVREVQGGERVIIANAGRPVAVLTAFEADSDPRPMGGWKDRDVWIGEDFDDPLPPEIQAAFEGR